MANYKQLFTEYMDAKGIKYEEVNEFAVRVVYNCENIKALPVYVLFDKDGDAMVQFKSWDIANFKNRVDEGIKVCHTLNAKYRWVKYYLDSDSDVVCTCDAYVDENTCGPVCLALVNRVVNISDEAYPDFMRALYS